MKPLKLITILFICLFLSFSLYAEAIFELIPARSTVPHIQDFMAKELQKLYSTDEDLREKTFDSYKETLEQHIYEEKNYFIMEILTSFVFSKQFNKSIEIDVLREEQAEAVELITEIATESDAPFSTRLEAIRALSSFLQLPEKNTYPFRLSAVKTLVEVLQSSESQLFHASIVALRPLAISTDTNWEDQTETIIDKIADRCSSSDPEIQRISMIEMLEVLKQATNLTSPIENMWEKAADCMEDIDSSELKESLHPKILDLVKAKQGTPFESFTNPIREQTVSFGVNRELELDPIPELLEEFRTTSSIETLEILKQSIQHQLKTYPEHRFNTLLQLASFATNKEVTHHKLRVITNTMLAITREAPYSMQYFHTSVNILGFIDAHRASSHPMIPLSAAMELLASTDAPGIQIPLLTAIKDSSMNGLPIWIKRKLVSILFYMADDSLSKSTRLHAFYSLSDLAKQTKSITLKWLAYNRIQQLSDLARNRSIKNLAAQWK